MIEVQDILGKIVALYGSLKNYHYTPAGKAFFATHKEADHMLQNLLDIVDSVEENIMMGNMLSAIGWDQILQTATTYCIPLKDITIELLLEKHTDLSLQINNIKDAPRATNAILDELDSILSQNIGFLFYTMSENDELV